MARSRPPLIERYGLDIEMVATGGVACIAAPPVAFWRKFVGNV